MNSSDLFSNPRGYFFQADWHRSCVLANCGRKGRVVFFRLPGLGSKAFVKVLNMFHFCTIITRDYVCYAEALAHSLKSVGIRFQLHVLVACSEESPAVSMPEIIQYRVEDVCRTQLGQSLFQRYFAEGNLDTFRWSMKSVFLLHLLQQLSLAPVMFVDPDIAFFDSPEFLFDALETSNILLTPHWRCPDPSRDRANFQVLQTSGLFNAGFIGVSRGSEKALEWWAKVCLDRCEVATSEGLFVDQAYLDLMPIYFEGVGIVRHRGCNVANWNLSENLRLPNEHGEVFINGTDKVVFVHFTGSTIRGIIHGTDPHLRPFLDRWLQWRGADNDELQEHGKVSWESRQKISVAQTVRRSIAGVVRRVRQTW